MWKTKSNPKAPKKKKFVINRQSWYSRKTKFELKYTENGDMTCFFGCFCTRLKKVSKHRFDAKNAPQMMTTLKNKEREREKIKEPLLKTYL